ncbi:hypothetical protein AB205_0037500 [Aquarana catesbeiana]|uniref:Uncharacterized protein n=1 Tax=Aquarana catesbeiana TaxID=8400 RepID=A0A2G9QEB6_AQUCT|nr:hypothetical protein AB205_0037500 [Aquarana catesbeiana]
MSGGTLLILSQYRPQSRSSIGPSLNLTFVITIGASNTPFSAHRSYVLCTRVTLYIHCTCIKTPPALMFFLVYSPPLLVWCSGEEHMAETEQVRANYTNEEEESPEPETSLSQKR